MTEDIWQAKKEHIYDDACFELLDHEELRRVRLMKNTPTIKMLPTLPITEKMVRKIIRTSREVSDERVTGEIVSGCKWCLPCFDITAKGVIMNDKVSVS